MCNYTLLLYIFRPREWPEYFGLQLGDQRAARNRRGNNQQEAAAAPQIRQALIGDGLFASNFASWFGGRKPREKKLTGSFSSDNSFESFGSMETDDPVIIVNPFDHTVHKSPPVCIDEDDLANAEEQKAINDKIESKLGLAVRDKSQKIRIDAMKAKGLYKSSS